MPRFWYLREEGAEPEFVEAENLPRALLRLQERGVSYRSAGVEEAGEGARLSKATRRLLTPVYEQLAGMLEEGAGLGESLRQIAAQTRKRRLAHSLSALADEVCEGTALSEAMGQQSATYSPTVRAAVRAGEEAGNLPAALRALARHQHDLASMAAGIAFPLVYPVLICAVAFAVLTFLGGVIFPKFMQLFHDLGMEDADFPATTRMIIAANRAFPTILAGLVVVALLLVVFWVWARGTQQGKLNLGLARLRVPILGEISIYTDLARVATTLGVLLRGGVETVTALRLSRAAAQELPVAMALRRAEAAVEAGGRIVEGLRTTGVLPEEFIFRLGTAEARGELTGTLDQIAEEYMTQADRLARQWIIISGPVIVILLAIMVGFIGFSMFSPLIGIVSMLSS